MRRVTIRIILLSAFFSGFFCSQVTMASSLSGRIWLDTNNNGVVDPEESVISDIWLSIYADHTVLNNVLIDSTGYYHFDGLPYSDYLVCLESSEFTSYMNRWYQHDQFKAPENEPLTVDGCTRFVRTADSANDLDNINLGLFPQTAVEQDAANVTSIVDSPVTISSPVLEVTQTLADEIPAENSEQAAVDTVPPLSIGDNRITRMIDGLALGHWVAIPGSQLDFLRACPAATDMDQQHAYLADAHYKWNFYCAAVINAENGATFDTKNNRMLVWGGGHADYAGNEVYAYNLAGSNPGWQHLNLPSPLPDDCDMDGGNYCAGLGSIEYLIKSPDEPDHLVPASRHTLDTLQYIPDMGEQGSLWSYSGSVWQGGDVSSAVWTFDTAQKQWTELSRWDGSLPDPYPEIAARPANILQGLDVFSVHDPSTGMIYAHGNRHLKQFNPKTRKWTSLTDDNNVSQTSIHSTAAYDYEHKKLVVIGGSPDYSINPSYYDIRGTGSKKKALFHDLQTTGDNEIQYADGPGIAYEPDADVFVAWSGGKAVYVLDMQVNPPRWEKVFLEGDDPGQAAHMGTFGRLRYVPDKKVMMLVNRVALEDDGFSLIKDPKQANVFFFRLPARFYKNGNAPEPVEVVSTETENLKVRNQTIKHLYPVGNIADAVNELIPGDTLIIHEGDYLFDKFVQITAQGTADMPVIITAAEGEKRPLISTEVSITQNTFNITGNASYITIKGLEISNGNHEDAIKLYAGRISHVTLEDLHIHDVSIGVRVAADADHLLIRNNHIHDTGHTRLDEYGSFRGQATGEGMYLGCYEGDCIMRDSIIENNLIHDSAAEAEQGDGIELKTRSHDNIVRNNVVYNMGSQQYSGYGGILVWGWSQADDTADWGDNIVEGNIVWGDNASLEDVGIEAVSHAKVRNNIVFNVHTGLASNPQFNGGRYLNIPVKDVDIVNNTVYQTSIGARLIWEQTDNAVFANNVIHSTGVTDDDFAISCRTFLKATFSSNVIDGRFSCEKPDFGFVENEALVVLFQDPDHMNFWLNPGAKSLIGQGNAEYAPADDFNGSERIGPVDIGAYQTEGAGDNPGWLIQAGQFKGL